MSSLTTFLWHYTSTQVPHPLFCHSFCRSFCHYCLLKQWYHLVGGEEAAVHQQTNKNLALLSLPGNFSKLNLTAITFSRFLRQVLHTCTNELLKGVGACCLRHFLKPCLWLPLVDFQSKTFLREGGQDYNWHVFHLVFFSLLFCFVLLRVEVNFSLPCKPPSFPSQGIRLSRPLSEGPHLVEIGQEVGIQLWLADAARH